MPLALVVSILLAAGPNSSASAQASASRDWAAEFDRAAEAASRGEAGGFDQLLSIVEADVSAE